MLLFGGSGQLGSALQRTLDGRWQIDAPASSVVDLTNESSLREYVANAKPDAVVNASAYTKVDDAEQARELAVAINATAPRCMAVAARELNAPFFHVSTDYVFDGTGDVPFATSAPTRPINVYGESKRMGEVAILEADPSAVVIRTAWLHSGGGTNFVATAVRLLSAGKSMRVVDDQVGTPTHASHLARAIDALLQRPAGGGMMHFTDSGVASWYDVACCVLETLQERGKAKDAHVIPVGSEEYPRPARRPRVSILNAHDCWRAIDWTPPHWRHGVRASTLELLGESTDA